MRKILLVFITAIFLMAFSKDYKNGLSSIETRKVVFPMNLSYFVSLFDNDSAITFNKISALYKDTLYGTNKAIVVLDEKNNFMYMLHFETEKNQKR